MKDSKEYSPKIQKLYRSLKRKFPKVQKALYDEPVDALVYAIVSEHTTEAATHSLIKKLTDYFVDWNELRVSQPEEITEVLKENTSVTKNTAIALTSALQTIFNRYNTISLMTLKKIGKRPAKQALEKINGTSNFVVNYCMLTALQSHAIPLTEKMTEYLKNNDLVHPTADTQQIEGFLARQISANKAYEFYALLRRQSESSKAKSKKSTTKRTKKKTARKTESTVKKKTKRAKTKK